MLLLGRRRVTGQELADKFEVSLRTIYRDLETINGAGIPIASYSGTDGGYEIMEQYRIDKQIVSADELGEIATALKGLRSSVDDKGMDRLLEKVSALLAKSEQERSGEAGETLLLQTGGVWNRRPTNRHLLSELRRAAKECRVVRFVYTKPDGNAEERTVEPVGLAWKGYAWYLYAFCRMRQAYRIFRLSRIKEMQASAETFPRRDVTLEELDRNWLAQDSVPRASLVLRFERNARIRAEEYFGEEAFSEEPDGRFLVRATQAETPWLYGLLLSYGPSVKVLEPPHIADIVQAQARQILSLYGESDSDC